MKFLLLALGLALCCFVQAEWEKVIATDEQVEGYWTTHAVACNSTAMLVQIKDTSAFIANLSRPQEDVFSMLLFLSMPDGCKNVTYQFRRGEDGDYHGLCDGTPVTVKPMKACGEFIMSTIKVDNDFTTTSLHSRKETPDQETLQKFKEECIKLGYKEEEIVVLKLPVKCP